MVGCVELELVCSPVVRESNRLQWGEVWLHDGGKLDVSGDNFKTSGPLSLRRGADSSLVV